MVASNGEGCRQRRVRVYDSADIRSTTIQRQVHGRFTGGTVVAKQHVSLQINEQQVRRL
jgi:hypothetical protein